MDIQLARSQEELHQCSLWDPSNEPIYANGDFHSKNHQFIEEVKSRRQWSPNVRPSNEPINVLGIPRLPPKKLGSKWTSNIGLSHGEAVR